MGQSHFAAVPNISIPRSRFKQPFNHATTFNHGDLLVLDAFPIIAGDTIQAKISSIVWMSTPIAPLFGNIKLYVKAYFVPMRLLWSHTEEFFGANKTSAGYQTTQYAIPLRSVFNDGIDADSLSHYLGKPITTADNTKLTFGKASVLKERGYYLIWNEHYRAEQVQNPVLVDFSDNGNIGTLNGNTLTFKSSLLKVNKEFDYFTAATLAPQYGPSITLPLGTTAPIITAAGPHAMGTHGLMFGNGSANGGSPTSYELLLTKTSTNSSGIVYQGAATSTEQTAAKLINSSNLVADLSNATAATINTLRYAFAVQKYLERSNFGSNRFYEILSVHYGVTSPDSRLQIPERLGGAEMDIVVNSVLSTADSGASGSSKVGQPGAVSCSAMKQRTLFTKAFVEPGYVYIVASTHHKRSYSQGLLREDTKSDRYEFYSPEFANLGDQEIKNQEIYLQGAAADAQPFGYQEHWAEYRYRPDRVSGLMDPQSANSFDFWTLTEDFSSLPQISSSFLEEDRAAIARALTTGVTGPDYLGDFYIEYVSTREMPLITIPGLIDHFGAM